MTRAINLHPQWQEKIGDTFRQSFMQKLRGFLQQEKKAGKTIFPPNELTFNALNLTPLSQVRVVIIGQDPYHNPQQAHGLCFSVPEGVDKPPSLVNILRELKADLGIERTRSDLSDWAEQGVLLLNSVLTVEASQPASHAGQGWEEFTDKVIQLATREHRGLAFILWGNYARDKARNIDKTKHFVVESAHPSPLSAERGFFGSRPFSLVNAFLLTKGQKPINW